MLINFWSYKKVAFNSQMRERSKLMKNMIEDYYVENGQRMVVMNQNTARKIRTAINGFRAGIKKANFSEIDQTRLTGEFVADTFLQDEAIKIIAKENYAGCVPESVKFLQAVEEKIDELL